jgi:hypothetical protein
MEKCCQVLNKLGIKYQQISEWSVAFWCSEPVAQSLRTHKNFAGFTLTQSTQDANMWHITDFDGASDAVWSTPGFLDLMKRLAK